MMDEKAVYIPPTEEYEQEGMPSGNLNTMLARLVENPSKLRGMLVLNDSQASNVKALIAGLGTAASSKTLSKYLGDELAAIAGAAISAYIARKLIG